ncbi:MAG: TadE family protein [Candidatus Binataceae bacterium]
MNRRARCIRPKSWRCRSPRGQAAVELALVLPIFFTLMFGIIDVGHAIYDYNFVSYAAGEATRYAIVNGANSPNPASSSDIQNFVSKLALEMTINSDCSGNKTAADALCATTTWTPNNKRGSVVQVTVQYNFQPLAMVFPQATIPLSASSEMVISQ